jgi:hypothetical protein
MEMRKMEMHILKTGRAALIGMVLFAVWPSLAIAHHSAATVDFTKPVDIKGVVQFIDVANPHLKLVLRVTDEKGTRDIEYEGHSRANLYRSGWRPDSVKVGDTVTVRVAPRRDGADGGYVTVLGIQPEGR